MEQCQATEDKKDEEMYPLLAQSLDMLAQAKAFVGLPEFISNLIK